MKRILCFGALLLFFISRTGAQTFLPLGTTGYNLDAIAENTVVTATTGGAIDGSNYVLYSAAYGALYSITNGLPNNGLVSSGTRTYQLQPYTQNNLVYLTIGLSGTLTLNTPAPYAGLSILGFATEGNATFDATIIFTDNSTQLFTNQSYLDWFGAGTAIIAGFDRVSRGTGVPANLTTGNPKMYAVDLPINCANRVKLVRDIVFLNTSGNARLCVAAVSGASAPSFSASSTPVTCSGGTNGSASITAAGGLTPYTYTWNTTPAQFSSQVLNLAVGVYSYSAQDNGGCLFSSTVAVTQSLVPEPPLTVTSNAYTVCSGVTFTMGVSGAATYTWAGGNNSIIYSPPVIIATSPTLITYTVSGITSANCLRTGSISVLVNPIPAASFISTISPLCKNSPPLALAPLVQQTGGTFSGQWVASGSFNPSQTGTFTITYTQVDANNCSNTATASVQVFSLAVPQIVPVAPRCANTPVIQLTVSPTGGAFSGSGVGSTGDFSASIAGAGSHVIGYTTTSGPCTTSSAITVVVYAAPTASFVNPKTFFCKNSPAVFYNGSPTGGTFSGTGMNGPSFNPALAGVSNSNVIVYNYTDANSCTVTTAITVTVSNCTGLEDPQNNKNIFSVYPNPSNGNFMITSGENQSLIITDELGRQLKQVELNEQNNRDVSLNLPVGIYFIHSKAATLQEATKMVITR